MIIDFHTHTFPDKIADKTIEHLSKKGGVQPYRKGTLCALKESMAKGGVDISVVLPVATAAKQVDTINKLSAELNGKDGVYFAGAVHPDCENIDEILDAVKAAGLFGIKIHPDYQGVRFNDERYIEIMKKAAERDLITVTHAGIDIGYPDDVHCTPDMVLDVLDRLQGIIDNTL
ncbi:MAG: amidohydrolase family protein, partial [Clostridia bacterium]|nr:amidohydrolase family protein [Clostridia bacterium]